MARSIRIQYPGAFYHVMARGNRRERIFLDEEDQSAFLGLLGRACGRSGWRVHAWALMGNHYHLALETPEANLIAGMQWLQNSVTRRFNIRHRKWGRVFGDRYKAVLIEGRSGYYYESLLDYIQLNPVRAGLVRPGEGESMLDFPWSSVAGAHALAPGRRPPWVATAEVLGAFGFADTVAGRRAFVRRLDRRAVQEGRKGAGVPLLEEEVDLRMSHLRRGWYWGRAAFAEKMLALGEAAVRRPQGRAYRSAGARRTFDQAQAERWLSGGLKSAGLSKDQLATLKGSDPRKVALARCLWENTTVSQGWLAARLMMGSAANVSQQIRRGKRTAPPVGSPLREFLRSVKI